MAGDDGDVAQAEVARDLGRALGGSAADGLGDVAPVALKLNLITVLTEY